MKEDVRGGWLALAVIKLVAGEGQLLVALRSLTRLLRQTTAVLLSEDSTRPTAAVRPDVAPQSAFELQPPFALASRPLVVGLCGH
ncbi:hypothetical protein CUJ88_33530 [Paraburkholderia hospita]|nr:hypothetical protein CUJ88_33530 [Paraburkholderia hospita]